MKKNDFILKELRTQINRLKYIEATTTGITPAGFLPRRIFIEPTNFCNYRCINCPSHTEMTRKRGYMDFGLFKDIIDELQEFWPEITINLYKTGEPLLHPQIYDMLDYANSKGFFVQINSNLAALRRQDIPRLLHDIYLGVSLDAARPESYKAIKQGQDFYTVLDKLLDYLEAWGESADQSSYPCDVIFLRQKANWNELHLFEEMFQRLPIGHVSTFTLHNFTGYIPEGNNSLPGDDRTVIADYPRCNTAWDVMGINWDGTVPVCIYDVNSRYEVGNVRKRGVLAVWNGKMMNAFRKAMFNREYDKIEESGLRCTRCSIFWNPDYNLPSDFTSEVARMEQYLSAAVKRVALQEERYRELIEKWQYLKAHRSEWLKELAQRGNALRHDS